MKFKGTWIFTFVVVAAVGVAIWDYQNQASSKAEEEKAAYLIQNFQMKNVLSFVFHGNAGSFKVENKSGDWSILEPIQDKGDYESLEGLLLGLAEQGVAEIELDGEVNWAQYGLDAPEATLSLSMSDGSTVKVEVGSKRAYNNGYYIRKNDENKLFLGSTSWTGYLSKTANDMRNRDLYFGPSDNNFVKIKTGKQAISFASTDGKWISLDQPKVLIDESAIYDYFNLVRHLRADAVVSDSANKAARKLYNLNKPALSITLEERTEGEARKWEIEFSKEKNNEVFVSIGLDRPVYRIQARKMDSLKKDFSHFRDRVYPFAVTQVNIPGFRIKRTVDKREFMFQKRAKAWMLSTEEPHMKVNDAGITNLFNDMRGLRVKEFMSSAETKKSVQGKYSLVLLNALGEPTFEMLWGDEEKIKEDARVKVWTSLANETFWMDAAEFKNFEAHNILVPDMATK